MFAFRRAPLRVELSEVTKYLVWSEVPLQQFLAEAATTNTCPHLHPESGLQVNVLTTKVLAASVGTLLISYPESGELADCCPLGDHLDVITRIVSWLVGQHCVEHSLHFSAIHQL